MYDSHTCPKICKFAYVAVSHYSSQYKGRFFATCIYILHKSSCNSLHGFYIYCGRSRVLQLHVYVGVTLCNISPRYWRCDISGAPNGKLHGKTIAMKDNISVAGIPMMNGSQLLEGYVPDIDASVVTRVLDEGGRILGKAVCESMCVSAGSFTAANGLVRNPWDPSRMSGGSSSGCAVLVSCSVENDVGNHDSLQEV